MKKGKTTFKKHKTTRTIRRATKNYGISGGELKSFLFEEYVLQVVSTNVASAQYFHKSNKMIVNFLSGGSYEYSSVSEAEARAFTRASSKGTWVDRYLKKTGRPYKKLS